MKKLISLETEIEFLTFIDRVPHTAIRRRIQQQTSDPIMWDVISRADAISVFGEIAFRPTSPMVVPVAELTDQVYKDFRHYLMPTKKSGVKGITHSFMVTTAGQKFMSRRKMAVQAGDLVECTPRTSSGLKSSETCLSIMGIVGPALASKTNKLVGVHRLITLDSVEGVPNSELIVDLFDRENHGHRNFWELQKEYRDDLKLKYAKALEKFKAKQAEIAAC